MSTNLNTIVEELSKLTILEAAELVKSLEKKWGVSAAATAQVSAAAPVAAAVEQTEFNVVLVSIADGKKLDVIKEVRAITALSLPDAKLLTEGLPKTIKQEVSKTEALSLKTKLESIGATIELK